MDELQCVMPCRVGDGLVCTNKEIAHIHSVYLPHLPVHPLILNKYHLCVLGSCKHQLYVYSESAQGFCTWESG